MKFIASKKLSDNAPIRSVIVWMLSMLTLAMSLSLTAKGIDFGITPNEWVNTVMGNEAEFIDPLSFNDLLLTLHTDLFGLILTFILVASVYMRTNRRHALKMVLLALLLVTLLLYPLAMVVSPFAGEGAVILSVGSFAVFHFLIMMGAVDALILLLRKRY